MLQKLLCWLGFHHFILTKTKTFDGKEMLNVPTCLASEQRFEYTCSGCDKKHF